MPDSKDKTERILHVQGFWLVLFVIVLAELLR